MLKQFLKTSAVLLLSASVVLAGCGGADGDNNTGGGGAKSDFSLGLVTDVGGVNDNSFNESAWTGVEVLMEEKGIKGEFKESKKDADYIPNLNSYVKKDTGITWGVGFLMGDAVNTVAKENPDKKLGIIDFSWGPDTPKNVAAVVFNEHEGSYLVGLIAGLTTKSDKIGFIGGVQGDLIKKFEVGFRAGVQAVNPNATVNVQYADDFNNPTKGKTLASTMYNQGIDIIYHASGGTGNGVFQEAKEQKANGKDVWVIGVDSDQSHLGPEITLTSMIKRVDQAIIQITEQTINGEFPGGETVVLALKDDGVGIAPTSDKNVPKEVLDQVEEYKQKIIAGEITVPATEEEFNAAK